jgi:UDP-N-acetylmuramate dehydrogenase
LQPLTCDDFVRNLDAGRDEKKQNRPVGPETGGVGIQMQVDQELQGMTAGRVRLEEPLAKHTTFRLGGPAEFYVAPRSADEVANVLQLVRSENLALHILGNGSNLIIPDRGVRGVVLHVSRSIGGIRQTGNEIHTGAGVPLVQLMQFAARHALTGLEWACGIPGTVGGALFTNAGTPAGQMSDATVRIQVVDPEGRQRTLGPGDFTFAYRHSSLRGTGMVAVGATLALQPGDRERIFETIKEYNQRRLLTQPVGTRNSGCIFKNHPQHRIGQEIERAGLKGTRIGGASVSTVHGNFIVNDGSARAQDVLDLIAQVKSTLESRLGVQLVEEVEVW